MYDNFILRRTENGNIAGYIWPLEDPKMVVCIVHGIGEYAGRYDRIATALNEHNIAVVSMDLRGHGLSMNKRGHCAPRQNVLDDVTELISFAERKYLNVPIVLYGHSMGGNIVLDYRCRGWSNSVPVGYIVSAPWIRLVQAMPKALVSMVKTASKLLPDLTIGSRVDESKLGNPDKVGDYNNHPMIHTRISLETAYDGYSIGKAIEEGTIEDNGNAKDISMLLMHGSDDMICSIEGSRITSERLIDEGQPVEFVQWPGFYHEIHNGGPNSQGDEVINKITDWLEKLVFKLN